VRKCLPENGIDDGTTPYPCGFTAAPNSLHAILNAKDSRYQLGAHLIQRKEKRPARRSRACGNRAETKDLGYPNQIVGLIALGNKGFFRETAAHFSFDQRQSVFSFDADGSVGALCGEALE
jgi:hypothetical protein